MPSNSSAGPAWTSTLFINIIQVTKRTLLRESQTTCTLHPVTVRIFLQYLSQMHHRIRAQNRLPLDSLSLCLSVSVRENDWHAHLWSGLFLFLFPSLVLISSCCASDESETAYDASRRPVSRLEVCMRIRVRQGRVCAKRLRQTMSYKRTQRLKLVLSRGRQVLVSLYKRFSRLLLVSIFSGHAQCLSRSEVLFFPDDSVRSMFSKSVRKSSWDLRRFVHSVTFSCLR